MSSGAGTAKPTAVLDSNLIVSGFTFPRGNPSEILELLLQGEIEVYVSTFILEEVSRVWRERFGWDEMRIEDALLFLRTYCTVIEPSQEADVRALTAADNRILDCTVQGGVHYLVTGDRGIQQLKEYQGIAIVSPVEFLAILRQDS
ncbi:MAG: putative toxin-antitoxin system toxin component, PIN family [Chloroflexi bacterium]|nr:putative toxin-antitoxin system toxin component, PIN family [Chloroflexota bacterium]